MTADRIRPDLDPRADPGWRLRISQEDAGGNVRLAEEQVLPEQVTNPDARRVFSKSMIDMTIDDVRWVRDQLSEILGEGDLFRTLLRRMLMPALRDHALPWRVERDWTYEVLAADGTVVVKCRTETEAYAIVDLARQIMAELATEPEDTI